MTNTMPRTEVRRRLSEARIALAHAEHNLACVEAQVRAKCKHPKAKNGVCPDCWADVPHTTEKQPC